MKLKIKLILLMVWVAMLPAGTVYADSYPARLDWSDRVELSLSVSGPVERIYVTEGQVVKKGTLLLTLDQRLFQANLVRAESLVIQEKEDHAEAKRELERNQELFDRTAISARDFQLVQIAYTQAEAKLRSAQATLVQARIDQQYSRMVAPFDALVIKRLVMFGQAVISRDHAQPLIVVARANKMVARTDLSARQLSGLTTGARASVIVNGKTLAGIIKTLGLEPVPDQKQAVYVLEVEFNRDAGSHLRKGQAVKIVLP